jgi:hypothetical protein
MFNRFINFILGFIIGYISIEVVKLIFNPMATIIIKVSMVFLLLLCYIVFIKCIQYKR